MSLNDASCPKCRKRFGWSGQLVDRPPCPRCGHCYDPAELAADQKRFDEMMAEHEREMLAEEAAQKGGQL